MTLDLESLETSFDLLAPRGDELMDEFYSRLFVTAPASRLLFPADPKQQKTILLATLVLLRKSLRNLDTIAPTLRKLGACNVAYGAKPEHYDVVVNLLVDSMREVLGPRSDERTLDEWRTALRLVSKQMIAAAEAP